MPRGIKSDNFFKPKLSGSESKAQTTTNAARGISDKETAAREQKTERLRGDGEKREMGQILDSLDRCRRSLLRRYNRALSTRH